MNFSEIIAASDLKVSRSIHRELLPIIVYINDDPGVTMTYFTARSNLET